MDFLELAQQRYSCRKFADKPVEPEKVAKVLAAAIAAPTAVNTQDFKLWLLTSEQAKADIRAASAYTFGADNFILLGCRKGGSWTRKLDGTNFSQVDGAIVGTHIQLAMQDQGLGTTWVGYFDAPALQQKYPEMQDYDLIALFPFGYPAEDACPSASHYTRKAAEELVEQL